MAKKKFENVVNETEEAAKKEEQAAEAAKTPTVDDLKIAYIVGLAEDGNFVFEVRGKNKGLVELMGIHDYATERIRLLKANALGTEEKVLQEIGTVLLQVSQKLDKLLQLSSTPPNKL